MEAMRPENSAIMMKIAQMIKTQNCERAKLRKLMLLAVRAKITKKIQPTTGMENKIE